MIRLINSLCFMCLIVTFTALYHIRYSAEEEARALRQLERDIILAENRRATLHAEWSSLNNPRRLQQLAEQYLSLKNVEARQLIDLRPADTRPPASTTPIPTIPASVAKTKMRLGPTTMRIQEVRQ